MPIYSFKCEKCNEDWEDVFRMSEPKESKCPKCKEQGQRVFTVPNASVDTKMDYDIDSMVKKTAGKKGNLGNLYDLAAEASEKRAEKSGEDPIKKKALEDYAKKRGGKQYKKPAKDNTVELEVRCGSESVKTKIQK